jgi:hypothetical protein
MSAHSPTSPSSIGSGVEPNTALAQRELDLEKKRARDRRSQQAMRDRNKWTIHTLTEQVSYLSYALEDRTRELGVLQARAALLEGENTHLRTQNAALQLSLMGRDGIPNLKSLTAANPWEIPTKNSPPNCLADQILQGFVQSVRTESILSTTTVVERAAAYSLKPNLASLVDTTNRSGDDISNVVADLVRTYHEIYALPKQVAVFYLMASLLKVRQQNNSIKKRKGKRTIT